MGRKCSNCGNIGHNSRTCTTYTGAVVGGLRLFGVQLDICNSSSSISMKKSFSLDCLSSSPASSASPSSSLSSSRISINENSDKTSIGYLSDGRLGRAQERKKGVPWTEKEHRSFLIGLEKLGKGDWRGISRNFVTTRTPTQVASHAQKHFLRQASLHKKKRRSSLFDMIGSKNTADHQLIGNASFESIKSALLISKTSVHLEAAHEVYLLDLNSFEPHIETTDQECVDIEPASHHHRTSIWPCGSPTDDHQLTSSTTTTPAISAPDLELTLAAAPKAVGQNKPSPASILIGPISVV